MQAKSIKVIIILFIILLIYYIYEKYSVNYYRKKLKHVIHVNGTRGKSTVTRMIYEGLYNAGYKVYAKTTGTIPMIIDTKRNERLIKRIGRANIKEQIKILKDAVKDNAEILVIECMAVLPEMQLISESKMLKADIMALTNIRIDHIDVMGDNIEDIEKTISFSIPKNKVVFTTEDKNISIIKNVCEKNNTKLINVDTTNVLEDYDFKENIALSKKVCDYIGVKNADIKNFIKDPYALMSFKWKGATFVNCFSANDRESTLSIYKKLNIKNDVIILLNNRSDRGFRVNEMIKVIKEISPHEVWVFGTNKLYVKNKLKDYNVICMNNIDDIDIVKEDTTIFAIGNIANDGIKIIEKIKKEGKEIV